jgi:two-component system CheB/CheR fusion protein
VDLLLCDVGMPVMDGYQLMHALRSMPEFAALPAIALTGYSGAAQERKTLEAGFDVHLTKPVSLATLVAAVERTIFKGHSG